LRLGGLLPASPSWICSKTHESSPSFDHLTLDQPIDGSNPSSPAAIGFSRDLRSADSAFDHL